MGRAATRLRNSKNEYNHRSLRTMPSVASKTKLLRRKENSCLSFRSLNGWRKGWGQGGEQGTTAVLLPWRPSRPLTLLLFSHEVMSDFFATPWIVAHQVSLSMEFPRQKYWNGLPFPPLRDLPDPGIKPCSPASFIGRWILLPLSHMGSPKCLLHALKIKEQVTSKEAQQLSRFSSFLS